MTSMEEVMFIAQGVKDFRHEQEKAQFVHHIGNVRPVIIQLLGRHLHEPPYELACEIREDIVPNVTVEDIIDIFNVIHTSVDKKATISQIVLTHKGREFLLKCLYPEKHGSLDLGIDI